MTYPTGKAETTIGNVDWAWTEAAHVCISTSDNNYVTIRGVQYHIGLHLFKVGDNWQTRNHHDLYASRPSHDKNYNKPVSDAARKTIEQMLRAWWLGFVSVNEKLGVKAQQAYLQQNVDRLEDEIKEIQSTLDAKQALLKNAQQNLEACNG